MSDTTFCRYIVNARSDGNSTSFQSRGGSLQQNLLALSGTSMSTPLVAGAAAIIREYLVKGYYNNTDGLPNPARAVRANMKEVIGASFLSWFQVPNPTAALIKAMIINSARPLRGLTYQAGSYVSIPNLRNTYYTGANFVEGFGAISLDQILPFGNASGFQLSLPNLGNRAIAGNESHQYCFTDQQAGKL
jgi:subtilisin family serine protease